METLLFIVRRTRIPIIVVGILGLVVGLSWGLIEGDPLRTPLASEKGPSDLENGDTDPPVETGCAARKVLLVEVLPPNGTGGLLKGLLPPGEGLIPVEERLPFVQAEIEERSASLLKKAGSSDFTVFLLRLNDGESQLDLMDEFLERSPTRLLVVAGGNPVSIDRAEASMGDTADFLSLPTLRELDDPISEEDRRTIRNWLSQKLSCPDSESSSN